MSYNEIQKLAKKINYWNLEAITITIMHEVGTAFYFETLFGNLKHHTDIAFDFF